MIVRALTKEGIDAFAAFLASLHTDAPQPFPAALLTSPMHTRAVDRGCDLEQRTFASRFEMTEYLYQRFSSAGMNLPALEMDLGLWTWLGLFYFEAHCRKEGGKYRPGAAVRWIAHLSYNRYYRHLVAGPFRIYRAHRDDPRRAMALLCGEPGTMGEVVEQIASRMQLVTNPAIVAVATALYYNPETGRNKTGAGGKEDGSPRRFAAVLQQFDRTFDLRSVSAEDLLALLPREFDRFRRHHSRKSGISK
jgi:hypothetical protein